MPKKYARMSILRYSEWNSLLSLSVNVLTVSVIDSNTVNKGPLQIIAVANQGKSYYLS